MGNTPEPCSSCGNLYYNVLQEDNPAYDSECTKHMKMGKKNCKSYINWKVKARQQKEVKESSNQWNS